MDAALKAVEVGDWDALAKLPSAALMRLNGDVRVSRSTNA